MPAPAPPGPGRPATPRRPARARPRYERRRRGIGTTASSLSGDPAGEPGPRIRARSAWPPRCSWSPPTPDMPSTTRVAAIPSGRRGSRRSSTGSKRRGVTDAQLPPRAAGGGARGLERVHTAEYLDSSGGVLRGGGGRLDPDTAVSTDSWDAALLAAGAGLEAVDALERGEGTAAFCAVRPPGHHALPARAMGFCLVNNVAVAAAAAARPGRPGADRRLGRAPRQRHPGHVLGRLPT